MPARLQREFTTAPLCGRSERGNYNAKASAAFARACAKGITRLCAKSSSFSALALVKNIYKVSFMRDGIGRWLVGELPIPGLHLQNWMGVAAAIVVLWILYLWLGGWLRRQD
jgi:hypothetical protein